MTIVSANAQVIVEQIIIETTILLVVMAINLVTLLLVEGVTFNATGDIVGHVLAVVGNGKRK